MKQPEVDQENVIEADIAAIALDERFGSLKFEGAAERLRRIQAYLKETQDLRYRDLLLPDQITQVDRFLKQLVERLQWLQKFDLSTSANPKNDHDNFETQVESFYVEVYRQLVMVFLPFLREERRRQNPEERKLDEEVREASKLRDELQKELATVRADIEQIKQTKQEVGTAKGERAATRLAVHFETEAKQYEMAANRWRLGVVAAYVLVLGFIGWVAFTYLTSIQSDLAQPQINTVVWISIGLSKLVLALALWYGLQFIVRNYNVNAHLAAVNRHRAAVASTLEDFIAVELGQEKPRLTEMLRNATEAMFKHVAIGYISKTDTSGGNPVSEVINNVISRSNGA